MVEVVVQQFLDCLEQLHTLNERFSTTNLILIGEDMNENITVSSGTQRNSAFRNFVQDKNLKYSSLGKHLLTGPANKFPL